MDLGQIQLLKKIPNEEKFAHLPLSMDCFPVSVFQASDICFMIHQQNILENREDCNNKDMPNSPELQNIKG